MYREELQNLAIENRKVFEKGDFKEFVDVKLLTPLLQGKIQVFEHFITQKQKEYIAELLVNSDYGLTEESQEH